MKKLLFLILISFFCFTAFSQSFNKEKLDSFFNVLEIKNKAMGSFAISKNGVVIYKKNIGYYLYNEVSIIKPNDNTLYRIGSTTKIFTATLIFQLLDEGKLTLDTKLNKYFPEIPNAEKISIQMLLNHRNGLYDFVNDNDDKDWITKPKTRSIILDKIIKGKTHFEPNTNFSYNNSGYYLLTSILEKIQGKPYAKILEEKIVSKLNLKNTFSLSNNVSQKNEALPYSFDTSWKKITDIYFPNVVGVGDMLSNPTDLIIFEDALFSGKLVSAKSLQLMMPFEKSFGMGLINIPFDDHIGYGHAGDTYGTHTNVFYFPKDSTTIAFCINGEVMDSDDVLIGFLSILFNNEYSIPLFNTYNVSKRQLFDYVGFYSNTELPLKIRIYNKGKILYARAEGQEAFPLDAVGKRKFNSNNVGVEMEFNIEENLLKMKQNNKWYIFKRIK